MTLPTPPKPTPAHFTDPYELGEAVAEVLATQGFVACFNGSYMSVYDTSQSPARHLRGAALASRVEDLAVRLLDFTANATDARPMVRKRARAAHTMLTRGDTGKVRYVQLVVAHARNCLPEVEDVRLPKAPNPEGYTAEYRRAVRQDAEDEALDALTAARTKGQLPTGRRSFAELWEWWQSYRDTPDVAYYYFDAPNVGRNRFYSALTRMEDTKVVTCSHRKYIYIY